MLSKSAHPDSAAPRLSNWEKGAIIIGMGLVFLIFGYTLYFCVRYEKAEGEKKFRTISEFDEPMTASKGSRTEPR